MHKQTNYVQVVQCKHKLFIIYKKKFTIQTCTHTLVWKKTVQVTFAFTMVELTTTDAAKTLSENRA